MMLRSSWKGMVGTSAFAAALVGCGGGERPADRALRDSAEALVIEMGALYDSLIAVRQQIEAELPADAGAFDRQSAARAVQRAEWEKQQQWGPVRAQLESETVADVDRGMKSAPGLKGTAEYMLAMARRQLERSREDPEVRKRQDRESLLGLPGASPPKKDSSSKKEKL